MAMVKKSWSNLAAGPISEEAIRALHQPNKKFKFYVNKVEPGKSLTTRAGHEFVLYILNGSCRTSLEGLELTLSASELITLEKGTYVFDVLGDEELKVMKVFSLL
jgi:hypothetical protein